MSNAVRLRNIARVLGAVLALAGLIAVILSPFISKSIFETLWGVEPLAYVGALTAAAGLALISLTMLKVFNHNSDDRRGAGEEMGRWSDVTNQYFALLHHDLGRPLARILEKERALKAALNASVSQPNPEVDELLKEIERQTPNFRLMLSNLQVLIHLEAPNEPLAYQPVEPSEILRRIAGRYVPLASEAGKDLTWWSEPSEFGIVESDSSAIEHIVTNLVDNAVRYASHGIEVRLTRNPTHFFVRVWDDGMGIAPQYIPHLFDRGWTPEVARRDEKTSSGLGLYIARTLARRYGGDITVESVAAPAEDTHTAFLVSLQIGRPS